MRRNLIFLIYCVIVITSCTTTNFPKHPKWLCSKKYACLKHPPPDIKEERDFLSISISSGNYVYLDFPNEDLVKRYGNSLSEEEFFDGNYRVGKIIDGFKEDKWLSGYAGIDTLGNVCAKGKIWKEEYFKSGLRDSIYRIFDRDGKIIYDTTFKMGTGLWKEFHSNGELYFEMYTKDGYFTDTLRLHDDKGKIIGKRLYIKDSLVYRVGLPCFPYRPSNVPSD